MPLTVIRCDASNLIGSGHVVRMVTLAHALRAVRWDVHFLCRSLPGDMVAFIEDQGFKAQRLAVDAPEVEACKDYIRKLPTAPSWLVFDHYEIDASTESEMRDYCERILVVDDLANRRHDCDLLLDQNFHAAPEKRYIGLVTPECRLLVGPRFALLRNEFAIQRQAMAAGARGGERILVSLGGTDPSGETLKVLEALALLRKRAPEINVDVVIGGQNRQRTELQRLYGGCEWVRIHVQIENMAQIMAAASLAVTAGGTTTWERLCLGLPTVVIAIADNQVASSEALAKADYQVYLGMAADVTAADIAAAVEALRRDLPRREAMSKKDWDLVDGQGAARVVQAMQGLAGASK